MEISMLDGVVIDCTKVYSVIDNATRFESATTRFKLKLTTFDIHLTIKSEMYFSSAVEFAVVALCIHKETLQNLTEQQFTQWLRDNLPEESLLVRYTVSRKPKEAFIPTTSSELEKDELVYDAFLTMMEDLGIL